MANFFLELLDELLDNIESGKSSISEERANMLDMKEFLKKLK